MSTQAVSGAAIGGVEAGPLSGAPSLNAMQSAFERAGSAVSAFGANFASLPGFASAASMGGSPAPGTPLPPAPTLPLPPSPLSSAGSASLGPLAVPAGADEAGRGFTVEDSNLLLANMEVRLDWAASAASRFVFVGAEPLQPT